MPDDGKSKKIVATPAKDPVKPCQLYLVCDCAGGWPMPDSIAAAIRSGGVASLLIDLPDAEQPDLERLAVITGIAQSEGVAVLVRDRIELVKKLGLDGVHLSASDHVAEDVARARATLGKDSIIGASAGLSRHLAMTLGEIGADYVGIDLGFDDVGFDELADPTGDEADARTLQLEFVAWWGEIIVIPCVAFGSNTPKTARALAANGADFIAMTLFPGIGAGAAAERVRNFDAAVQGPFDESA